MTVAVVRPSVDAETIAPVAGRHDLRLVPAALAGWSVVLCSLHLGPIGAVGFGAVGVFVAGAAMLRGRSPAILAIAGVVAALALVVGTQTWQVERHPVRAAAERGLAAAVTVRLHDDPRAVASPGYGGRRPEPQQVVIRAELESAQIAGQQWRTGGRVILLAPAGDWTGLLPGQRVRATGLLAVPDRPDLTVAVLRVRAQPQVLSAPTAVQRVAERLRSGLRLAARVLDPEPAGLLPALVVGDTSAMVPAVQTPARITCNSVCARRVCDGASRAESRRGVALTRALEIKSIVDDRDHSGRRALSRCHPVSRGGSALGGSCGRYRSVSRSSCADRAPTKTAANLMKRSAT